MAIEKQQYYSRSDDELCSLVFKTFTSLGSPSSTDAVITIDEEEENKKTNNLTSNSSSVPSTCAVIIVDDDDADDEETLKPKKNKKPNNPHPDSLVPCTSTVIIIDEEETLEPKKKKPRLESWWDEADAFNELSCVVKDPRSLSSSHRDNLLDLCGAQGFSDSNIKEYQDRLGYGHMLFEDSCALVEDPRLGGYVNDIISHVESNTNKDDERSLSSSNHHDDNFIDFREEETVGESTNSCNRGNRHVSLEELGVSVEDLKNMPWEAFDPTWEIRSETMDPWLGGYIQDMFSAP